MWENSVDPISQAITLIKGAITAYKAWAATHAIAAAAIKVGASIALSKALTPKVRLQSSGTQLSFQANPQAPIPFAFGRTATAGTLVFQYPSGPKNKHLNMFPVLSGGGPIDAIEAFKMNTQAITWNAATGKPTNTSSYKDRLWLKTSLGVLGAAAIVQPSQPASDSALPEWSANHKLSGYAHAWLDVEYDPAIVGLGSLQPLFVLKGVKCYDPRLDSTYPGGSGTCRVDDRATWVWSENPWICGLTWCLGFHANGKRVGGVGVPASMIDMASFVEAANVADVNNWTCGGVVTSADSKWGVLQSFAQAGGGVISRTGALISCRVYAPRVALDTITVNDLAGGGTIPATKPRRERFNSFIPSCRLEAQNWQMVACAPVTVADYVAFDGALRTRSANFELVQDAKQAAQLAAYEIVNAREIGPIALPLKPRVMGYEPGDALTVHIPEKGLNNQLCVITGREPDFMAGTVTLTFETETTPKHDFALGRTASPPPPTGLTRPDFATVPAPMSGQWSSVLGTDTSGLPSILVTGSASDNPYAREVIVEYRSDASQAWKLGANMPRSQTVAEITGLASATTYEVAVSYRSIHDVVGDRLILSPVTTGQTSIGNADDTTHVGGRPSQDVLDQIDQAAADLADEVVARAAAILTEASARTAALQQEAADRAAAIQASAAALQAGIDTNGQAIGALQTLTTQHTDGLSFLNQETTYLWGSLNGKADGAAFTALQNTVAQQGDTLTSYGASITSLTGSIAGKADSSTVAALQNTVTQQGDTLNVHGESILSLNSSVTGINGAVAGQAAALQAIEARVSQTEDDIISTASQVASVSASVGGLSATVSSTSVAVAALQNQSALAAFELIAAASGGAPARLRLVSSSQGSSIALDAPYIFWGANTVFDDATDTLRTQIGSSLRVLALGAAFGASGDLTEWEGPTAVAFADMSRANAYFWRSNTPPYAGGVAFGSLSATSDSYSSVGYNVSGGSVSTSVVTISVTGGAGPYRYNWFYIDGDQGLTPSQTNRNYQSWFKTMSYGDTAEATWGVTIIDSTGKTSTLVIGVVIADGS